MALIILSIPFYLIFVTLAFSSLFGKLDDTFSLRYPHLSYDTLDTITLFVRIGMFLGSLVFLVIAVMLCSYQLSYKLDELYDKLLKS